MKLSAHRTGNWGLSSRLKTPAVFQVMPLQWWSHSGCNSTKFRPAFSVTCSDKVHEKFNWVSATLSYTVTIADAQDNEPVCVPSVYYVSIDEDLVANDPVSQQRKSHCTRFLVFILTFTLAFMHWSWQLPILPPVSIRDCGHIKATDTILGFGSAVLWCGFDGQLLVSVHFGWGSSRSLSDVRDADSSRRWCDKKFAFVIRLGAILENQLLCCWSITINKGCHNKGCHGKKSNV